MEVWTISVGNICQFYYVWAPLFYVSLYYMWSRSDHFFMASIKNAKILHFTGLCDVPT